MIRTGITRTAFSLDRPRASRCARLPIHTGAAQEADMKAAFARANAVCAKGAAWKGLADRCPIITFEADEAPCEWIRAEQAY